MTDHNTAEQLSATVTTHRYTRQVSEALDAAYQRIVEKEGDAGPLLYDITADRPIIIFSDQHKGARNRADDFLRCEQAYNAALSYYYHLGHTLVVLGDVEELWEERPGAVVRSYRHTLELEARYHAQGRYVRVWGNHDDAWMYPDMVLRHLVPIYGAIEVLEGFRLQVTEGEEKLGLLLLLHGHQGTGTSDQWSWFSRLVVRLLWRPFQRLTGISLNTPANDWRLREKHNIAMYSWAAQQRGLVLIAGHTHRPVFLSKSHAALLQEQIKTLKKRIRMAPADESLRLALAEASAELEWARAQGQDRTGAEGATEELFDPSKYCYFNTGCCSFFDGNITGLELRGDQLRLVRWPDNDGEPRPTVLASASIRTVFAELRALQQIEERRMRLE